jgi:signal transduction histidine kinase
MKLSKYKTSTILSFISIIGFSILSLSFLIVTNHFAKRDALEYAKERAEIILDKNLSIHDYFNINLKPNLFKTLKDSANSENYFDPSWMSSTYAIKTLDAYFENRNSYGYYYKDAALNARSIENEADEYELEYLKSVNNNPDMEAEEGLLTIDDNPYYYLLKKGETMDKGCLICHSTPENAPKGLVNIYGDKKSFNRSDGEIISVVSVRIPLKQAFKKANHNIGVISLIILIIFIFTVIVYYVTQKRLIFNPLSVLNNQAISIAENHTLLGKPLNINTTAEITQLFQSFNSMSNSLFEYNQNLEDKIEEKTISLQRKVTEVTQLNSTKDKMLSIISHDLRTPFNALVGFSEMLVEEIQNQNSEKADEYAKIIQDVSNKTLLMLDNLLKWTLTQTGELKFNPEQFNLPDVVHEIVDLKRNIAIHKQITINLSIQTLLAVYADRMMITTILRNLVSNAIKFTDEGGEIIIAVCSKDKNTEITVSDTGRGIEKERLNNIFKENGLISKNGTNNEEGTGLGLILCNELVKKHGGKIWVESTLGNGSRFSFTIPNN